MKLYILMTLSFFLSINIHAARWDFHREYGSTMIYKSPESKTRLTLEYKQLPKSEKVELDERLFKKLESQKKKLFKLMGISKWNAYSYKVDHYRDVKKLTIDGDYINQSGEKVYFSEVHFFAPERKLQLLLTNSNLNKLKENTVKNSLQGFRIKYGF